MTPTTRAPTASAGPYLLAEALDKVFFKMRYDDNKPTLFAMAHGCALKGENGFDLACVEPQYLHGEKYDDDDAAQQQALALIAGPEGLRERIAAANDADALGRVLDLDNLMNYAAVATTVGHWDSAYGNFNNDFLYLHAPSGKWNLITWDGARRRSSYPRREIGVRHRAAAATHIG